MEDDMASLPHDLPDVLLAPMVLRVDARLAELGELDAETLRRRIASDTNNGAWSREHREQGVLESLEYLQDMHGWQLSMDPRGVRVSHGVHSLVLGVPEV